MHVSDRDFRRLVDEALARIPAEFRPYLDGVSVVIEDWAPDALLEELPPRITLYRGPLLEDCRDEEELREAIATTVIHEVAHHFGISEARLEELGWG